MNRPGDILPRTEAFRPGLTAQAAASAQDRSLSSSFTALPMVSIKPSPKFFQVPTSPRFQ